MVKKRGYNEIQSLNSTMGDLAEGGDMVVTGLRRGGNRGECALRNAQKKFNGAFSGNRTKRGGVL